MINEKVYTDRYQLYIVECTNVSSYLITKIE